MGLPQMQDVYAVYSTEGDDLLHIRLVIAGDRADAIATHRENYPDNKVIGVFPNSERP
jgi:hypothetical protein